MVSQIINVGIDNGAGMFQLQTSQDRFMMENKIDADRVQAPDMKSENTYNVIYKGKNFLVGNGANDPTGKVEGKGSERHLIAMLVGLSQKVPSGFSVNIGTGESMNKYFDAEHKKKFLDMFLGEHKINVDGKDYTYTFKNLHILPEGVGHKLLEPERYKNKESYTIDLGASTANFIFSAKGVVPDENSSFSFHLGMHSLISNVMRRLARSGYSSIQQASVIESYIKNGAPSEDIQMIIDDEARKLLDTVIQSVKTTIDLDSPHVREIEFLGGTALCIEKQIKQKYPTKAIMIQNGTWSNVEGFAKFVISKYSR